jgi:hypothetical protein
MKITHSVALNFNPIFIPFIQLFGSILDFGLRIADLLYRFALSFFIKLIRRRLTLNPNSKLLLFSYSTILLSPRAIPV